MLRHRPTPRESAARTGGTERRRNKERAIQSNPERQSERDRGARGERYTETSTEGSDEKLGGTGQEGVRHPPLQRAESYRVNCKYFPRGTATSIQFHPPCTLPPRHPVGFKGTRGRLPPRAAPPVFPFSCSPGSFHSSTVVKILGFPRGLVRSR